MPAYTDTKFQVTQGNRSLPIGVFDSGFGGISVLRVLAKRFPNEDFLFFGDNANAPYGVRSQTDIEQLTVSSADAMRRVGIKALVIACNTATGVALETLQNTLPIPVAGIRPALALAQSHRKDGQILVMATPATLSSPAYEALARRHGERAIHLPCPGLMEFVERGELSGANLNSFLSKLVGPYTKSTTDAVVLGCTHYPLLQDAIAPFFPDAVMVDGSGETTDTLEKALKDGALFTDADAPGRVTFLSSAGMAVAQRMAALYAQVSG